jgi:hypothetical protein
MKEKPMNIRISNRFYWMPALLMIISLACKATSPAVESTPTTTESAFIPPVGEPTIPSQTGIAPIGLPDKRENQAGDEDSSANANRELVSGGEKFVKGLYERPFNAETMDTYFPYLDIVDTQGFKDDTWGFTTITMSGTDTNGHLPGNYAVELDLNKDGRGEWLILVSNPTSTDWTTQGVQAWNDVNGDVGGGIPTVSDENIAGDGYETLVFDQGKGDKVDDAWARISVEDPKTITIAFKLSLLGDPASFAMGAWAGSDSLNPALFDHNDHMTHAEAGSPIPDFYVYPLKKLAEIDNTCRIAIGFVPTGREPGLCQTILQEEPGAPAPVCVPSAITAMNICR